MAKEINNNKPYCYLAKVNRGNLGLVGYDLFVAIPLLGYKMSQPTSVVRSDVAGLYMIQCILEEDQRVTQVDYYYERIQNLDDSNKEIYIATFEKKANGNLWTLGTGNLLILDYSEVDAFIDPAGTLSNTAYDCPYIRIDSSDNPYNPLAQNKNYLKALVPNRGSLYTPDSNYEAFVSDAAMANFECTIKLSAGGLTSKNPPHIPDFINLVGSYFNARAAGYVGVKVQLASGGMSASSKKGKVKNKSTASIINKYIDKYGVSHVVVPNPGHVKTTKGQK
jgi:hypothetical protein